MSSFRKPDDGDGRDRRRTAGEQHAPVACARAQPKGGRKERADDRELTKLDADVETCEREHARSRRKSQVGERAREAEAMQQPEAKRGDPRLYRWIDSVVYWVRSRTPGLTDVQE